MSEKEVSRIFADNLRHFMDQHDIKQNELAKRLGVSESSVSNWLNRINVPRTGVLQKLTEIFDCKPSDLLYDQKTGREAVRNSLSSAASRIGLLYDHANERDQSLVRTILEPYAAEVDTAASTAPPPVPLQPKPKVRERKDCFVELVCFEDQLPAAGIATYFDAPRSHIEQYPASLVPDGTSFGVPIAGDSMEPSYPNGATVFVKSAPRVENGEIGLFSLNGGPLVKQLVVDEVRREVRLHSLNSEYEDILIREGDDLRCFGRVTGYYLPPPPRA